MQTFIIINPHTKEVINTADNLNKYSHHYIKCVIEKQITKKSWNPNLQYKAVGSEGDTIIYDNGSILGV
jgi:hypothetical protein